MTFTKKLCLCLSLFLAVVPNRLCQTAACSACSDKHVLESLGDHGDRLFLLEQVVKNLTQEISNLKSDVHHLSTENDNLKKTMLNVTIKCEAHCGTSNHPTTKPTSNHPTTTPTTPHTTSVNNQPTSAMVTTHGSINITVMQAQTSANVPTVPPVVTSGSPTNATAMAMVSPPDITTVAGFPSATSNGPANATVLNTSTSDIMTTVGTSANTTSVGNSSAPSNPALGVITTTPNVTTNSPLMTTIATTSPTSTDATTTSGPVFDDCEHALGHEVGAKVVQIKLGSTARVIKVECTQENGTVWMVIQRRVDGSVNFDKTWQMYKIGFGNINPNGEYWLGNENIHQTTYTADHRLRIDMRDWDGNSVNAEYEHFRVGDEASRYTLVVGSYSGTAGDSFHYPPSYQLQHHQVAFSTRDHDNDNSPVNCARELRGGWWFNDCYSSNLNGAFIDHPFGARTIGESYGQPPLEGTGIEWYPYKRRQYSMRSVEMKITKSRVASIMG
ncbi:fibrinogen alpha chain-like isoform X2 [Dreissena polymorpha]|uniref:fibrinogen alpha chain-like isoform X2 n=1 Tax=Dreissena polymorpha TaxID=45954 RepID=UPI002263E7B6|nr:fibrinogen alpha chain-like isoform X2 [Dreissena polymorpha]